MKFLNYFQGNVNNIMYTSRELTDDEKELWKTGSIDFDSVAEKYPVPNAEVLANYYGKFDNHISLGYDYGGILSQQTSIKANNYYRGKIDSKVVYCIASADKAWTPGTELPDNSMEIIDVSKYMVIP